jgi:hypothetical protein
VSEATPPRPVAGMTRTVPGWRWLEGPEAQAQEWAALTKDFWGYIKLNTWEMATITKDVSYNEVDRTVILHMEAEVIGKITPGGFHIGLDG